MNDVMTPRARLWLTAALAPIAAVGVFAFAPLYDGIGYAVAGGAGLVAAATLAVVAWRLKWAWWLLAPVAVLTYLVISAPTALRDDAVFGVLPTPATLAVATRGVLTSWKDSLTAEAPLDTVPTSLLVPLLLAFVCGLVAFSLSLRARRPGWALVPVAVLVTVAMAFGTYFSRWPTVQGVVIAVGAIGWLSFARHSSRGGDLAVTEGAQSTGFLTRSMGMASGLLAISAITGVVAHGAITNGDGRDVLRDHVDPPFDIHQYASPLQSYRGIERDSADVMLLKVAGLPDGARVRLATLDAYDGTVFGVGATGQSGSGAFEPLRKSVTPARDGVAGSATITVGDWSGVWVPDVGYPTSFVFSGDRATELERTTHYNSATFTAATAATLKPGDSYTVSFVLPAEPAASALSGAVAQPIVVPSVTGVPESIRDLASGAVEGATSDADRMLRMAEYLKDNGYFSHGIGDTEPKSLSGHGTARIDSLVTSQSMVGDDEQYAVTLALMARVEGLPSRVVMGFYPASYGQPTYSFTGSDLHVWTEVAFADLGWVPFFPTPDESKPLTEQDNPPQRLPKPQVLQPQPPADEPAQAPPTGGIDDETLGSDSGFAATVFRALGYAAGGLGVLLVLLGPAVAIVYAKARRRRRRRASERASDRIRGGWDEVVDAAHDAGLSVRRGGTRTENARELETTAEGASAGATTLALAADAGVFGARELTDSEVDEFWRDVDAFLGTFHGSRGNWGRWRSALSMRSLAAHRGLPLTERTKGWRR